MSHASLTAPSTASDLDVGPLTWILPEVREAIHRFRDAVSLAVTADADTRETALHRAGTFLHQAHGALQMIDLDCVASLTAAMEHALTRAAGQPAAGLTPALARVLDEGGDALLDYLDELRDGAPQQPLHLFPYYRAILEESGQERVDASPFFLPHFNIVPAPVEPGSEHATADAEALTGWRQRYEKSLLLYLKATDEPSRRARATDIRDVLAEVEHSRRSPLRRGFWRVLHAFAGALSAGKIDRPVHAKQILAQINLQLRRADDETAPLPERLVREALLEMAAIGQPDGLVAECCDAYAVRGRVPADYERKRYTIVDAAALMEAKERLGHAKTLWARIAAGEPGGLPGFCQELSRLEELAGQLGFPMLEILLADLRAAASASSDQSENAGRIGIEAATALLFLEQALAQVKRLPADFAARANALSARLQAAASGHCPPESADWLKDMTRQAQQRQTMAALSAEIHASLRQIEKSLDTYFAHPHDRMPLAPIDDMLHQIEGALAVLDQDQAAKAIRHIRETIAGFADDDSADGAKDIFHQVARNIGALSFFVETLQRDPEHARQRFAFDATSGLFNALAFQAEHGVETVADPLGQPGSANPSASRRDGEDGWAEMDFNADASAFLSDLKPPASSVEPADTMQGTGEASDDATDAELLDIFLSEAEEVLACIRETLPEARRTSDQEPVTTLRRSFHTLKGSSRMVGLDIFGEAAWSVERLLNAWLAGENFEPDRVLSVLQRAADELDEWVNDIRRDGRSSRSGETIRAVADGLRNGEPMTVPDLASEAERGATDPLATPEPSETTLPASAMDEEIVALDTIVPPESPAFSDHMENATPSDTAPSHSAMEAEATPVEIHPGIVAGLPIGEALAEIAPGSNDAPAHADSEATAGGNVLHFPMASQPDRIDETVKRIGQLEVSVPLHAIYLAETDTLARLLRNEFAEWRHEPERTVSMQAVHAAHSLAGSSATIGLQPVQEIAHALEMVLQRLLRQPVVLADGDYDLLDSAVSACQEMLGRFALSEMPAESPATAHALDALLARILQESDRAPVAPPDDDLPPVEHDGLADEVLAAADPVSQTGPEQSGAVQPDTILPQPDHVAPAAQPSSLFASAMALTDELDDDLLPVFIEEARDLLPRIGETLRNWRARPQDVALAQSLLRNLHTVKGSARMAGAMRLGQHTHELESRVEHLARSGVPARQLIDDLLAHHDYALFLFESLQGGAAQADAASGAPASPAIATDEPFGRSDEGGALMPSTGSATSRHPHPQPVAASVNAATTAAAPLMRVRADILDRLVNQAGEVSISRSRLETEVGALRESLGELTENVQRLRTQLREIEIQAETQIASSMAQAGDRRFDPLEFDRFTRLQELTRTMAESVNDVASVQQNIARTVDNAASGLVAQARLTRELQQDLMRVRMVQFGSIAERLYRLTRQTAKEIDKRVNLDLRGASAEIDRSVLERMTGPFEHLLRNAIVHGIEPRDARRAAGKNETGELLVEIRQEGNEVVIRISDDGRGLDTGRIRDKATALGLIGADGDLSEAEAGELIFLPGLSTAADVTELAGRGIGMDVVRTETAALGGRIAVFSEAGRGTQFTIHLPLTLAVTQVVLLSSGGRIHAVPSVLVEQVVQLKANSLAGAYNDGTLAWQGGTVPLHYLSALLGDASATPVAQQYCPILVLGSGGDRVAVHVDEVIGNREVVVKNVGPQLSRMIGVAGATVLGSGEIVLILNPVPLAQSKRPEDSRRAIAGDGAEGTRDGAVGAVAEIMPGSPVPAPVAGLRTQRTIMIVDDSLTVRRVTQRLLSREGYQVVLAKDGVDALEQLQGVTPDVMLVDIEMPRMDGFDLTRNVRGDERTRQVPIIMITSRTAAKHRNLAFELGVNDYLGKPYVETDLLHKIAGFIGRTVDAT